MNAGNTVQKMLSPQEMAMIENISSMVDQLKSNGMGGEMMEEEVMMADAPMMNDKPTMGEMRDDEMMMAKEYSMDDKMMAAKADMGPNANPETKAEDRVEDGTEITEGNYSEVGKSLAAIAGQLQRIGRPRVAKAAPKQDTLVMSALAEITKVMKSISDRQEQSDTALVNILDGLGVVKAVQKSEAPVPVANVDGTAVLQELTSVLKSLNKNNQQDNGWGKVRKSGHQELAQALPSLLRTRS